MGKVLSKKKKKRPVFFFFPTAYVAYSSIFFFSPLYRSFSFSRLFTLVND